MNTKPNVSRFADRANITIQPNTAAKAKEEKDDYNFSVISRGHFACDSIKATHIIIDKDAKIGCSCGDMTYRCTDNNVCKHIAMYLDLKVPPQTPAPGELIKKLILMGWVGGKDDLHPAEMLKHTPDTPAEPKPYEEPDPVLDQVIPEMPEPPNEDCSNCTTETVHYECPNCGDVVDVEGGQLADWILKHLDTCSGKKTTNSPEAAGGAPLTPPISPPTTPTQTPETEDDVSHSKTPLVDNIRKYVGNDVLEVFGDTGSGKSKFALEVAREATAAGLNVFYLDSERNLTDEDVKMLGSGYKYTPVLKEIDDTIRKLPAVDVVIIDSIGFPILTAYARYSMKQKGDALLTMIAMFGDLKQWAYKNNGLVIVVNQPESTFNKDAGHILRPFGDKSQFAAKEIWWLKMVKRADKTTDHHTEIHISSFRGRTLGYGDKLYTMNIRTDGIEFVPMR